MTHSDFKQLTAFARQDGLFMGLLWIASFACFVGGFQNQILMLACMVFMLSTPFLAAKRLKVFRDYAREGSISFNRAFAYSILIFFYGSLILAAAIFVYFSFLDNGYLYAEIVKTYSRPEMEPTLKQIGMTVKDIITLYSAYRPIDFAMQSITSNVTFGIFFSIPIAALLRKQTYIK